ncbi:MAG: radical SAM family heme chaperone HemW [Alphaproteobacteria bacterium]|nr:radical SAM family heme chaperone HemW [Rickettsiales bacterium]
MLQKPKQVLNKIGIYIHWPYCQSKCPYCDFNSYITPNQVNSKHWLQAYIKQLQHFINHINTNNYQLESIFFGGGTPSLMNPEIINELITFCTTNIKPSPSLEISLESNPSSVETEKFTKLKKAGINRISIGVQSLDDKQLKWLGRTHNAHEAKNAILEAKAIFKNYSFDLIYSLKSQTPKTWEEELTRALYLAGNHLSLYSLTIEKETKFGDMFDKGKLKIPDQQTSDAIYDVTQKIMQDNNFKRYEVSNYTKNNKQCKHNMLYWNNNDFIGIGPNAAGRFFNKNNIRIATKCTINPKKWLQEVMLNNKNNNINNINLGCTSEQLSKEEQIKEILLMGTRVVTGINVNDIKKRFSINLLTEPLYRTAKLLELNGLLKLSKQAIIPTPEGMNYSSGIVRLLCANNT